MIAVTGSTGLLGSFIVRTLVERNMPVVAIKRTNSDTHLLDDLKEKITWRDGDIEDIISLEDAFQNVSTVIHAAAVVSYNPRDKQRIYQTNVIGTENVVNVCLSQNIKKLIHISSIAAIGRPKKVDHLNEEQKWVESPYNSAYAQSKHLAELEVMRAHEEGLNTIIVNPSVILGPGDIDKSSGVIFKYVWKERPFYIDGHVNYVSVRDVVRIIEKLITHSANGQRFIVNAGTASYYALFKSIATKFHKKNPHIRVSKSFTKVLATLATGAANLTGTEPIITRELARSTAHSVFFDNTKVKTELSFDFEPLEETLEWCCQYYIHRH